MSNRINFTQATLESLPSPSQGRITYMDTKQAGLHLRVTAKGIKTFSVYKRTKGGGPERITLGRYPDMKIDKARAQAADFMASFAFGKNPADIKRTLKGERTFAELFTDYLERHAKPKKLSWVRDKANYDLYLAGPLGRKKLSAIKRADIAAIHSAVIKEPKRWLKRPVAELKKRENLKSGTTANRILALASSIFNWGIDAGICDANPAKGIRKNPEKSRARFLQADELRRFFEALALEPNEVMRDFFLISLLTGARRANVLAMRWSEISFERREWTIPRTKNGDPQTITLTDEAMTILNDRKAKNDELDKKSQSLFVFVGEGKTGHLAEPCKGWLRTLKRAGLEDLRIHDLRRTLGSWQAKTGASLVIIGKSLNHKHHSTTQIYARLDLDPVRQSVERATAAMLEAAGVKSGAEIVKFQQKSRN